MRSSLLSDLEDLTNESYTMNVVILSSDIGGLAEDSGKEAMGDWWEEQ